MNTFEAFGLTFPLSALLYLGLALLIACCVLAGVMGAKVGEQQTKESIARALPPLPQRPHAHDWTTARALDEDQRDACCLCGQRREQLGDDTLAMVADMWDSFEEASVHGIEVDDTAAEADMVPANGPAVIAHGRALVADIDAWMDGLDVEAWLGERGWL